MKNTVMILIFLCTLGMAKAQDFTGDWSGELSVQGMKLPLVMHISQNDNVFVTTLDSPMQGAKGIPTGTTTVNQDSITVTIPAIGAIYRAKMVNGKMSGTFTQSGMSLPLELSRGADAMVINRPQEPKPPFSYSVEEVSFKNPKANNISLAGTLTLPTGVKNPPVAIMITGSGPQNRDEELLGHKPFLVIADHLTKNGIAVLRYDDRGVAKSGSYIPEGKKDNTSYDFADDASAALDYLLTRGDVIDPKKIGYIGHSEGGLIAPMVAAKRKDVAFCILLAGPGVDGKEILLTQSRRSGELSGASTEFLDINEKYSKQIYDLVIASPDQLEEKLKAVLNDLKVKYPEAGKALDEKTIDAQIKSITSDWMSTFLSIDPADHLTKVKCPVLAINGEKDFQVLPDINLKGIEAALQKAGNKDVTIKTLPDLNHLFQHAETGAFEEYAKIEETFAPEALELITTWLKKRF